MSNPFWKRKSVRRKRSRAVNHQPCEQTEFHEALLTEPQARRLASDVRCMLSRHIEGMDSETNLLSTYWECEYLVVTI